MSTSSEKRAARPWGGQGGGEEADNRLANELSTPQFITKRSLGQARGAP